MRLKIVGGPEPWKVKVVNAETGEPLPNVQHVQVDVSLERGVVAEVTLVGVELDLDANGTPYYMLGSQAAPEPEPEEPEEPPAPRFLVRDGN